MSFSNGQYCRCLQPVQQTYPSKRLKRVCSVKRLLVIFDFENNNENKKKSIYIFEVSLLNFFEAKNPSHNRFCWSVVAVDVVAVVVFVFSSLLVLFFSSFHSLQVIFIGIYASFISFPSSGPCYNIEISTEFNAFQSKGKRNIFERGKKNTTTRIKQNTTKRRREIERKRKLKKKKYCWRDSID